MIFEFRKHQLKGRRYQNGLTAAISQTPAKTSNLRGYQEVPSCIVPPEMSYTPTTVTAGDRIGSIVQWLLEVASITSKCYLWTSWTI